MVSEKGPYTPEEGKKLAMKVSWVSVAVNLILSLFKLLAGLLAHSGAMISDSIHSASDVFSTFIVMIGVQISSRQADKNHQYGHERFECVASVTLAIILLETGLLIGWNGLKTIFSGGRGDLTAPGVLALAAAVVSILVKEWMYWYTRAAARKIGSDALMADAWHHRSDSLSSIGALVGIAFSMAGFPVMDSVASVVICVFIAKAAIDIFRDAVNKMVDQSCDEETLERMTQVILQQEGVLGLDLLQTRLFGTRIYVDAEISAHEDLSLRQAHAIAEQVHEAIEEAFPMVKHCMVHVNPREDEKE
ncbi:MAG: cation diffusion facilitator family transporter [Evtepia sp.]|uniref:cation diffusion facilitator family transporter n=1 Tax=Evtepia sp. TaxID=2773933 RepID=UPI002A75135B|nr:cation diffusion facilitator family transporter [Evtepia sp.]MDY3014318.1 cation diffusion facilitator family transporter [Evtepia sp.]